MKNTTLVMRPQEVEIKVLHQRHLATDSGDKSTDALQKIIRHGTTK